MAKITIDPLHLDVFNNPKFFFQSVDGWIDRYTVPATGDDGLFIPDGNGTSGVLLFGWRDYVEGTYPDAYFPIFPTGANVQIREVHFVTGTGLNSLDRNTKIQSDSFFIDWTDDGGETLNWYEVARYEVDKPISITKFYDDTNQNFLKGNDIINGSVGNDIIDGFAGNDTLYGYAGDDTLLGNAGNDVLMGGAGNNLLNGGLGNDTYYVDFRTFDESVPGYGVENRILDSAGLDQVKLFLPVLPKLVVLNLPGEDYFNFRRTGLGGKDFAMGVRAGAHQIGDQDDWYARSTIVDQYAYSKNAYGMAVEKVVIEQASSSSLVNLAPAAGSTLTRINGTNATDLLIGFGAGNTLNGNGGSDFLIAGRLDSPEELRMAKVLVDGVVTSLTGWLVKERYLPVGFSDDQLKALVLNDAYSGSMLFVPNLADAGLLIGDTIYGGAGEDFINGFYGNDYLDGGAGVDVLAGREGNDTYVVDDVEDWIVETGGVDGLTDLGGVDTVVSATISLDLNDYNYLENATLTGSKHLNLTGDGFNNLLMGNAGNNILDGGFGNDTLRGGAGNDTYHLQEFKGGNDVIVDSGGADTLQWEDFNGDNYVQFVRVGNDLSIRTHAIANRDELNEWVYADTELVQTTTVVNFWGTGFVENFLTKNPSDPPVLLKFAKSFSGTNNNELFLGTDRADVIKSLGGVDIIWGGNGNDQVDAGAGNDQIEGGLGADTLTGGLGADVFMFNAVSDSTNASLDVIRDFSRVQGDRIGLHYMDENVNEFGNGRFAFAETAANYSVWTGSNGKGGLLVFADVNGDASADFKVELLGVTRLEASDFIL